LFFRILNMFFQKSLIVSRKILIENHHLPPDNTVRGTPPPRGGESVHLNLLPVYWTFLTQEPGNF
jgi:hypothetical protein